MAQQSDRKSRFISPGNTLRVRDRDGRLIVGVADDGSFIYADEPKAAQPTPAAPKPAKE